MCVCGLHWSNFYMGYVGQNIFYMGYVGQNIFYVGCVGQNIFYVGHNFYVGCMGQIYFCVGLFKSQNFLRGSNNFCSGQLLRVSLKKS